MVASRGTAALTPLCKEESMIAALLPKLEERIVRTALEPASDDFG